MGFDMLRVSGTDMPGLPCAADHSAVISPG